MTRLPLFALAASWAACAPGAPAPTGRIGCAHSDGLADHQPAVAHQWGPTEALGGDEGLSLRVVLPLRSQAALEGHLGAMVDPSQPRFGQVLTREQLAAQHLPAAAAQAPLAEHLAASGLASRPQAGGMVLATEGPARAAHAAFGVLPRRLAGQAAFAAHDRPRLPRGLDVVAVRGLSSTARYQSHAVASPAGPGAPLEAANLRRAYRVPAQARGAGQRLAVVALDGYRPEDVATYCRNNGLREVPRRQVLFGKATGEVVTATGAAEMAMDIELLNAMAPDAVEIVVLTADAHDPHAMNDILAWLVDHAADPAAPIWHVSCSWGAPESQLAEASVRAEGQMLATLAAMGVTFWAASGDLGAMDDGSHLGVDDPASQVWAAGVGGTRLELTAAGDFLSETTWPGTGGGESCFWPAPSWQAHLPDKVGVGKGRRVPDVALAADPARGHHLIVDGKAVVMGGTSAATPAWAAFAAVVDGERARVGKGPVGFWPAQLYARLARGGPDLMHDIADEGSNGFYASGPGRDDATGWGSPLGDALLPAMVEIEGARPARK